MKRVLPLIAAVLVLLQPAAAVEKHSGASPSPDRMMGTVKFLSSGELKGRGLGTPELDKAAGYIAEKFKEAGLKPAGDTEGSYFQVWVDPERKIAMKNVVGVIPETKKEFEGRSVVIGAHYDHLGLGGPGGLKEHIGKIHPGADDNASGVAVLIELARVLSGGFKPDRSIVFIAFTGEESGRLGSRHYVGNEKRYPAAKCIGMVNLDTVGRLGNRKLLVLGAGSAREWEHVLRGAGAVAGVAVEMVAEDLDSSDQKSFEEAGVPAVQLFSGPHPDYHRPGDTIEKVDAQGLVKVAAVTRNVVEYLANAEAALTSAGKEPTKAGEPKKERRVSIGTIPDFAYKGDGVRLSGVVPGSPAEDAGMKEGDVIIKLDETPIRTLKDFSEVLKSSNPGDRKTVVYMREGKEKKVEVTLRER